MYFQVLLLTCLASLATIYAQQQQQQHDYTTPVPILKQIDRQNSDGSYTYGYEGADKSFKIETKYPNGEVYGKYGYVDDQGNVREIEYGASRRGFEPAGSDINVPPPTLTSKNPYPLQDGEQDDGQYREDPAVYYKNEKFNRPVAASKFSLNNFHENRPKSGYAPAPQAPAYYVPNPRPYYHQQYHPTYQQPTQPPPTSYYQPQSQYPSAYQQPYYQQSAPQPQYNPYNPASQPQHFHPAVKSLDLWSGSYSLDYTGRK